MVALPGLPAGQVLRNYFLVAYLACWSTICFSQTGWEAGLWVGGTHYFGDLNTQYSLRDPGGALGLMFRYNTNNRIALKLGGNYGMVSASDANSTNPFELDRNLSFRSPLLEFSGQLEFNFLPFSHGSRDERFSPYFLLGASVVQFNPQTFHNGRWIDLRPLGTEGQLRGKEYYTLTPAFLFGVGLKVDLVERWSLQLEWSARNTFTDYLDDVSTVYPNRRNLIRERGASGSLAAVLSDRSLSSANVASGGVSKQGTLRGNPRTQDAFTFLQAGILYFFGNLKCPDISRRK